MTKVNIRFNPILDKIAKGYCFTLPKYRDIATQETDIAVVDRKVNEYKSAWQPIERGVFNEIEKMTGRPFPYSRLSVNLVWVVDRTEAHGMIIPLTLSPDGFIMTLTHELMHLSGGNFSEQFKTKYSNESLETRVHIMIHAMTECLWRNTLNKPEYVERHKARCRTNNDVDYIRAWEIVEEEGYKNILQHLVDKKGKLKLSRFFLRLFS